tara:strand:- start:241 stop:420 length:180 start_codon:yes stop_codon:yes gene_type:complete
MIELIGLVAWFVFTVWLAYYAAVMAVKYSSKLLLVVAFAISVLSSASWYAMLTPYINWI